MLPFLSDFLETKLFSLMLFAAESPLLIKLLYSLRQQNPEAFFTHRLDLLGVGKLIIESLTCRHIFAVHIDVAICTICHPEV
jgi:hypothetical protein